MAEGRLSVFRMGSIWTLLILSLLSFCSSAPVIYTDKDLVELIRSGKKTVVDARWIF